MSIDKVEYWLDVAQYDLDTAEAMYSTQRWLYVGFMCHQVIEKTLKAYWCKAMPNDPPYVHDHVRLADGCGLYSKLSDVQKRFIALMRTMNIEARYPEHKQRLAQTLTKDACRSMIDDTKQMQLWIKEQLLLVNKH